MDTYEHRALDTPQINVVSLCTGYAGIELALREVFGGSLRTLAYVERELFGIENLVAKMEAGLLDVAPVYMDLRTFDFGSFYGLVDILTGGFPCQPFSLAGSGCADSDPRHLFPFIKEGIKRMRPRLVFLENVEGILSAKLKGDKWTDPAGTPVLLHVLRELERVGYRATAGVFSAAEVGAPHQRKRVFIFGVLAAGGQQGLEGYARYVAGTGRELPWQDRSASPRSLLPRIWPSRPGEPQHEWEPPRVMAQPARNGRREGRTQSEGQQGGSDAAKCSESMDDPRSFESGGVSDQQRKEDFPARDAGEAVGNTESNGSGFNPNGSGEPEEGWEDFEPTSEGDVADSQCPEWREEAGSRNGGRQGEATGRDESTSGAGECGRDLGVTSCELLNGGGTIPEQAGIAEPTDASNGQVKSGVGVLLDGASNRLGNSKLHNPCDSRTDELKLLGNGVVPQTAAKAFVTLFNRLWWEL